MDLIDRHRRLAAIDAFPALAPRLLRRGIGAARGDDGCRSRRLLGLPGVGIGLQWKELTIACSDFIFVERSFGYSGQEDFPDTGFPAIAHGMAAAVPVIETAHDAHSSGIRRPNREGRSDDAIDLAQMSAQPFIDAKMPT